MNWQPRVSVGDDLARLHESSRAADMSRDLGYSSISMGEGSLDLIVGDDAENVRVVLGDQSDGRFGIGLWHRGGMKYLPDVLESAEDRITGTEQKNSEQDGRLNGHDADVSRIDAKNTQQDGRLTEAEGRLGSAEGRLDGVEGRMGTAEGRLDGLDGRVDGLDGRVGRAEDAIDTKASKAYVDNKNESQDAAISAKAAASALADAVEKLEFLESTRPTRTYVDNLNSSMNDKLDARVTQLMTAIRLVASRADQPDPLM